MVHQCVKGELGHECMSNPPLMQHLTSNASVKRRSWDAQHPRRGHTGVSSSQCIIGKGIQLVYSYKPNTSTMAECVHLHHKMLYLQYSISSTTTCAILLNCSVLPVGMSFLSPTACTPWPSPLLCPRLKSCTISGVTAWWYCCFINCRSATLSCTANMDIASHTRWNSVNERCCTGMLVGTDILAGPSLLTIPGVHKNLSTGATSDDRHNAHAVRP